jgi:drug/metabolite transporter, DME family
MQTNKSLISDTAGNGFLWGILCGFAAAIGYTACNICLRAVAELDPFFVSATRTIPTLILLLPIMLARPWQGLALLPSARVTTLLTVTGIGAHVIGNGLFQYALSIIGLALAVPLSLGSMIISGAILGRLALGEPITPRMFMGLTLLITAIFVLSGGTEKAANSVHKDLYQRASVELLTTENSWQNYAPGLFAGCSCGFFYALLGATIRREAHGNSIAQTLSIVSGAGLIALLFICWYSGSWQQGLVLSRHQFFMLALAGIFNALSFMALTRALQLTSLVYVHGLNASQATMAAIAGVFFFQEAVSPYLFIGLMLTVFGLLLMALGKPQRFAHEKAE